MSADDTLRFPWPTDGESAGLTIRLFARDRIWIASLRREVDRWRASRQQKLPLVHQGGPLQLPVSDLHPHSLVVVEVTRDELAQMAAAIDVAHPRALAVVALLCRTAFDDPADRLAAAQLLREAGATITLATPSELPHLQEMLDWAASSPGQETLDPISELPLPCWSPAWQRGGGRIGLSNRG